MESRRPRIPSSSSSSSYARVAIHSRIIVYVWRTFSAINRPFSSRPSDILIDLKSSFSIGASEEGSIFCVFAYMIKKYRRNFQHNATHKMEACSSFRSWRRKKKIRSNKYNLFLFIHWSLSLCLSSLLELSLLKCIDFAMTSVWRKWRQEYRRSIVQLRIVFSKSRWIF